MSNATCADCGNVIDQSEQPDHDRVKHDRCADCNTLVFAVDLDNGDGPQHIGDSERWLSKLDGSSPSVGQCPGCGGSMFVYRHSNRTVVCSYDPDSPGHEECGATYYVRLEPAYNVVF